MKQRHRKHRRLVRAIERPPARRSVSWLVYALRQYPWRKKKRIRRKWERFFGGEQWSDAQMLRVPRKPPLTINMIARGPWLGPEAERAIVAGLPIGRDGKPVDPEKFGVITFDSAVDTKAKPA